MYLWKRKHGPARDDTYSYRFKWQGKVIVRKTPFANRAEAAARARADLLARERGLEAEADRLFRRRQDLTIGDLLNEYLDAGCPDRAKRARSDATFAIEERNIDTLWRWWAGLAVSQVTNIDQDKYHSWRLTTITRGTGDRTTELELNTLRNALSWAVRSQSIEASPFTERYRFRDPATIKHAAASMPRSGDELHQTAARLLATPATEVYGWQMLLQALTGLRDGECALLLASPQVVDQDDPPPGHYTDTTLYVIRLKHGINPRIRLDDPDRPWILPLLRQIGRWHALRHPRSPYLLPGPRGGQLPSSQLSKLLPEGRTGHGLRAYYCTVRLNQTNGATWQVAVELGQRSGDALVREVYGHTPDAWQGVKTNKTWLPNTPGLLPAWQTWQAPSNIIAL